MKTIIVTSNLTYTPQNYNNVLESVLRDSQKYIAGVILIKINLLNILAKLPYLYFVGCENIANTLAHNIGDTLLKRKEKLFGKYNTPFIYAGSISDPKIIPWIQKIEPDLILNMRAKCMYKDSILKIPRLGCVNIHHGVLPQQRGLFCDLYALGNNREAGFTIHKMTSHVDQGQIFYQEKNKGNKNYMKYLMECSPKEAKAIASFINNVAQNNCLPEGTPNKCEQPIVTVTPDSKAIKQLQHNGLIL